MPLLIVVVVVIIGGVIWRARASRRLTIEESVDRYRRTLSAVHEASTRAQTTGGDTGVARAAGTTGSPAPTHFEPMRHARGSWTPTSRRQVVVATLVGVTVIGVAFVVTAHNGKRPHRSASPPTTQSPTTRAPTTTTTVPAPTTTVPLVSGSGTTFTVGKPTYTLVVQATSGACWIEARDASGASLFAGTLSSGQSQSISASTVKLQLGNPAAVTLNVDGTPVPFALAGGSPVTLQFQGTPA